MRSDLEGVVRHHDGYIASSPELEHYVHPLNWLSLRSMMSTRYAALITGQSGTGKTMATMKLYEELRQEIPGLSRVSITRGPKQIRDDRTERPVLYDVEDPWGRFDFDPINRPWNDQLAQLFAHATHDRMIVATSRMDVAQSAGALESVRTWIVPLEAEHYGIRERRELYRTRIDALPRTLQLVARQGEKSVLANLSTPLEIQKFFDALPMIDRARTQDASRLIDEAIRQAHQDSIERTVIEQIEQRKDVPAAAILWGLLKVSGRLSLRLLRIIEEEMADGERTLAEGVSPLVNFFVTARNLRQTESTVTYYHPRVESGIERVLGRHPLVARKTLRQLVGVLTSIDVPGDSWGVGAAARLIAANAKFPEFQPTAASVPQRKIDLWLGTELRKADKEFHSNLLLAAAAGSPDSIPSEVARFLLPTPVRKWSARGYWEPPAHNEAWYSRAQADPATKPIVETFIREVLPTELGHFLSTFATEVERLTPDLSEAFLAAAQQVLRHGYIPAGDAIAEGAIKDLDGFESIVSASVAVLTPSDADLREERETHLAIINGEYSEDYAEHLADNDDGYMAGKFLEAYVDRVRSAQGWRRIAQHSHCDHLRPYWLRSLAKQSRPSAEEIAGAFMASHGSKDEDELWHVLLKSWGSQYLNALVDRVIEGHAERSIRIAALTCLIERAPEQGVMISNALVRTGKQKRLIEIAIEIGGLRHDRSLLDGERHADAASAATSTLPPIYNEISEAAFALRQNKVPSVSPEAQELILGIRDASEELRAFRVALDQHIALPVFEDVSALLAETASSSVAVEAIEAGIRHGMTAEIETALNHRFADVSARALTSLATNMTAPLPNWILDRATAKGSPVRRAVVRPPRC